MGKKIILLLFILLSPILAISQTQIIGAAKMLGSLTIGEIIAGSNILEIDSAVTSNDSIYLYDGTTKIPIHLTRYSASSDLYADDNFIFDGDAGDERGTNTEPDYANVSLAQTNCSDAVSTAQAHGGTRSIAITSTASGATYYGGLDITNSSIRRPTYAGLSYRFDFWVYVPSSESWSGNLTVTSTGTTNGKQTWANQSISADTWTHIECDVDIEGDESIIFDIEYTAGGAGEIYYLDDMRWRTIYTSLGSEEFTYADCESDIPTVNAETWSTYNGTWARSTDYSRSGSYSMKGTQTAGIPETMDFRLNGDMSLTEGYYLCIAYFYIPTSAEIRDDDIGLYHRDGASFYWIENLDEYLGGEGSWYKREVVRYISNTPETSRGFGIRIYDEASGGGTSAYVDDFSMKKITF